MIVNCRSGKNGDAEGNADQDEGGDGEDGDGSVPHIVLFTEVQVPPN